MATIMNTPMGVLEAEEFDTKNKGIHVFLKRGRDQYHLATVAFVPEDERIHTTVYQGETEIETVHRGLPEPEQNDYKVDPIELLDYLQKIHPGFSSTLLDIKGQLTRPEAPETYCTEAEKDPEATGITLEELLEGDEYLAEYSFTSSYTASNCIAAPESTDIAGMLEETLHRILDHGGTEEDVRLLMGAIRPTEEEMLELEETGEYVALDLGYVIPGFITCFYEVNPTSDDIQTENDEVCQKYLNAYRVFRNECEKEAHGNKGAARILFFKKAGAEVLAGYYLFRYRSKALTQWIKQHEEIELSGRDLETEIMLKHLFGEPADPLLTSESLGNSRQIQFSLAETDRKPEEMLFVIEKQEALNPEQLYVSLTGYMEMTSELRNILNVQSDDLGSMMLNFVEEDSRYRAFVTDSCHKTYASYDVEKADFGKWEETITKLNPEILVSREETEAGIVYSTVYQGEKKNICRITPKGEILWDIGADMVSDSLLKEILLESKKRTKKSA